MALVEAFKEAIWIRDLVEELGKDLTDQVVIFSDSQSVMFLSRNQTYHERTNHIDVWLYFIKEIIIDGKIKLEKIASKNNVADVVTKSVQVKILESEDSQDWST